MKVSALRLYNVKRFANCGVAIEGIGDGVNMLCAANEFGKSTSFEALQNQSPNTEAMGLDRFSQIRRLEPGYCSGSAENRY